MASLYDGLDVTMMNDKTKIYKREIVLFVTANKNEMAALISRMQPYKPSKLEVFIGKNSTYLLGRLGGYAIAHVHCLDQGSSKSDASMTTIGEAIQEIKPKAVIAVGIAFGIDSNTQEIGDVIISTGIQPYEYERVSKNLTIDRNKTAAPNRAMINIFSNYVWKGRKISGVLLSGEKLIDDKDFRDALVLKYTKEGVEIVGGEMEGAGISATLSRNGITNWIVIKAICDFADGKKAENKDYNQKVAADNAVGFCESVFCDNIIGQLGIKRLNLSPVLADRVIINPYELFLQRHTNKMSFERLARETRIEETFLRRLENLNEKEYKEVGKSCAEKLRVALKCGNELFSSETSACQRAFYNNHKGKKSFFPTKTPKAIIFDFDGTITTRTHGTTWQMIWMSLGYSRTECDALYRKFVNGDITHKEWCEKTTEKFIAKNLTKMKVEEVAMQVDLIKSFFDVIRALKNSGILLYMCSGSINTVIEKLLGDSYNCFEKISCNEFVYTPSGDFCRINGTPFDFKGKADFICEYVLTKTPKDECLFIGNSNNDEYVSSTGISTLAVNPTLTDVFKRNIWTYCLGPIDTLCEIYPYVFPFSEK